MVLIMRVQNMGFTLLIIMLAPNVTSRNMAFNDWKVTKRILERNFISSNN